MKSGYIYIMSNYARTTLYIGVTNNLLRRVIEHRDGTTPGFTTKYRLKYLVYFEAYPTMGSAITREKQLKNWHHDWKLNLIRSTNPNLKDLAPGLIENFSKPDPVEGMRKRRKE